MKPAEFDYVRPETVEDAVKALVAGNGQARIIAGGQSLVPMLNLRLMPVSQLVDVARIPALRAVTETETDISFGAGIRHAEFEDGSVPDPAHGLMRRVASRIAYRAIRNRGTIGGSAALADPSADWVPLLIALDARFRIEGPNGMRECSGPAMFHGPYTTALGESDILTSISIRRLSAKARTGFEKIIRKAGEYPMVVACAVRDEALAISRVVLGAANRPQIVLEHLSYWLADPKGGPESALHADLEQAGRTGDAYELALAKAALLRAIGQVTLA